MTSVVNIASKTPEVIIQCLIYFRTLTAINVTAKCTITLPLTELTRPCHDKRCTGMMPIYKWMK